MTRLKANKNTVTILFDGGEKREIPRILYEKKPTLVCKSPSVCDEMVATYCEKISRGEYIG